MSDKLNETLNMLAEAVTGLRERLDRLEVGDSPASDKVVASSRKFPAMEVSSARPGKDDPIDGAELSSEDALAFCSFTSVKDGDRQLDPGKVRRVVETGKGVFIVQLSNYYLMDVANVAPAVEAPAAQKAS